MADDVMAVLKASDVFLPNEQEAYKLTGTGDLDSALDALSRLVPVVSSSAERKAPSPNEAKTLHAASLSVQPVDTVGAGDSFNAGFPAQIHSWSRPSGLPEIRNVSAAFLRPVPAEPRPLRPPSP